MFFQDALRGPGCRGKLPRGEVKLTYCKLSGNGVRIQLDGLLIRDVGVLELAVAIVGSTQFVMQFGRTRLDLERVLVFNDRFSKLAGGHILLCALHQLGFRLRRVLSTAAGDQGRSQRCHSEERSDEESAVAV